MFTFLVVIHVITCTVLVITVLLQQGKGAEIGAVFGSSEAIFGSTGPATLLSKVTTVSAVVFMLTSLSLTYLSIHNRGDSVMRKVQQAPVMPAKVPSMPVPVPGQPENTAQKAEGTPQGGKAHKIVSQEKAGSSAASRAAPVSGSLPGGAAPPAVEHPAGAQGK